MKRKPCPECGAAWVRDATYLCPARTRRAVYACGTRVYKGVVQFVGRTCLKRQLAQLKAVKALLQNR